MFALRRRANCRIALRLRPIIVLQKKFLVRCERRVEKMFVAPLDKTQSRVPLAIRRE